MASSHRGRRQPRQRKATTQRNNSGAGIAGTARRASRLRRKFFAVIPNPAAHFADGRGDLLFSKVEANDKLPSCHASVLVGRLSDAQFASHMIAREPPSTRNERPSPSRSRTGFLCKLCVSAVTSLRSFLWALCVKAFLFIEKPPNIPPKSIHTQPS